MKCQKNRETPSRAVKSAYYKCCSVETQKHAKCNFVFDSTQKHLCLTVLGRVSAVADQNEEWKRNKSPASPTAYE